MLLLQPLSNEAQEGDSEYTMSLQLFWKISNIPKMNMANIPKIPKALYPHIHKVDPSIWYPLNIHKVDPSIWYPLNIYKKKIPYPFKFLANIPVPIKILPGPQ